MVSAAVLAVLFPLSHPALPAWALTLIAGLGMWLAGSAVRERQGRTEALEQRARQLEHERELAGRVPMWVTGYANDVMAYIPSRRVLKEGGYEADSSMIYYGMPTKWGAEIEEKIVGKVHELVKELGAGSEASKK